MKKVFFVSYFFPPHSSIGAQRPYKLTKYFPQFGWDPVVLTSALPGTPPKGIRVIETEYKDILNVIKAKLGFRADKGLHEQIGIAESKNFTYSGWKSNTIKLLKELIAYPDTQRGWYKYALKDASDYLSRERADVIISSSYPVTSHLIARQLKKDFGIPWVADLRDLWTQNPYVNKFQFIKFMERQLELKTLSDADAIVTVTQPWISTLKKLHKNKKIFCVTNGYDTDDFPVQPIKLTDKFTITYTGILYNGKRDPSMLFNAASSLIKENKLDRELLEIRFYGPEESWLSDEIEKYDLAGSVRCYGQIPRNEALERQRESQLLLLLLWDNAMEEGFCPGKIYEYFGARRPIIATGWSRSIVRDMLESTNSGSLVGNQEALKDVLLTYYEEFLDKGVIKCRSSSKIETYSYQYLAEKYASILNDQI